MKLAFLFVYIQIEMGINFKALASWLRALLLFWS